MIDGLSDLAIWLDESKASIAPDCSIRLICQTGMVCREGLFLLRWPLVCVSGLYELRRAGVHGRDLTAVHGSAA